jgi:hypothetical protein
MILFLIISAALIGYLVWCEVSNKRCVSSLVDIPAVDEDQIVVSVAKIIVGNKPTEDTKAQEPDLTQLIRTQWFNMLTEPPVHFGHYEYKRVDSDTPVMARFTPHGWYLGQSKLTLLVTPGVGADYHWRGIIKE